MFFPKVNAGRRKKNLKIVTPDWLWSCAECWEHVEERIFPLSGKGSKNRHPPPHCSSPEHVPSYPVHDTPALRKRTPSGRFMDTINPLMSFSRDDIADMDKVFNIFGHCTLSVFILYIFTYLKVGSTIARLDHI